MSIETFAPPTGRLVAVQLTSRAGLVALALSVLGLVTSIFLLGMLLLLPAIIIAIRTLRSSGFSKGTSIAALIISSAGVFVFALMLVFTIQASNR